MCKCDPTIRTPFCKNCFTADMNKTPFAELPLKGQMKIIENILQGTIYKTISGDMISFVEENTLVQTSEEEIKDHVNNLYRGGKTPLDLAGLDRKMIEGLEEIIFGKLKKKGEK